MSVAYANYYVAARKETIDWTAFAREQGDNRNNERSALPFPTKPPQFTPAELVKRRASAPAETTPFTPSSPPFPSPPLSASADPPSPPSTSSTSTGTKRFTALFRRRASAPSSSSPTATSSSGPSPPPSPPQTSPPFLFGTTPKRPSLFRRSSRPLHPPPSSPPSPPPLPSKPVAVPAFASAEDERYGPLVAIAMALEEVREEEVEREEVVQTGSERVSRAGSAR